MLVAGGRFCGIMARGVRMHKLYVVNVSAGHAEDVTLRARRVLREASLVVALTCPAAGQEWRAWAGETPVLEQRHDECRTNPFDLGASICVDVLEVVDQQRPAVANDLIHEGATHCQLLRLRVVGKRAACLRLARVVENDQRRHPKIEEPRDGVEAILVDAVFLLVGHEEVAEIGEHSREPAAPARLQ